MKNIKKENIIKDALKYSTKEIIFRLVVSILLITMGLIIPITESEIISNISNKEYNVAFIFLGITVFIIIVENILNPLSTHTYWKVRLKITRYLSSRLLKETFNNSSYSLSRFNFSLYSNILINDISSIADFYSLLILRIIRIVEIVFILVYFYFLNIILGLITTIVIIINIAFLLFMSKKVKKINKEDLSTTDNQINTIEDIFKNMKDIKNFNINNNVIKRYEKVNKKSVTMKKKVEVTNVSIRQGSIAFIQIIRHVVYAYGIYLIMQGEIEIGTILIIYGYFDKLMTGSEIISNISIKYNQAKVSENRYMKMFRYTRDNKIINHSNFIEGDIKFNNIIYGDINNPSLNNVNFVIKKNKITILDGDIESGAYSVFKLLGKLNYQHSGNITINDIDINTYSDSIYQNNVCRVDKNPMFFNLSIKDNLLLINDDFDLAIALSKMLKLHEHIMKLSKNYDTILLNDCSNVTLKIRYLLEILRVFLIDPKIILFDDIFDMLDDVETNNLIHLIEDLKFNKTIIIKTENTDIVKISDEIIKFDGNNVSK